MTRPLARPGAPSGFTLVEVMITVAIVAILATIALPAYTRYIERGRVQEGLQGLAESRTKMEQFYMDNRAYDCSAALTEAGQFNISCEVDAGTYTVTATGVDSMTGFVYTINAQGAKTSTFTDRGGWGSGGSCWITKPGETC